MDQWLRCTSSGTTRGGARVPIVSTMAMIGAKAPSSSLPLLPCRLCFLIALLRPFDSLNLWVVFYILKHDTGRSLGQNLRDKYRDCTLSSTQSNKTAYLGWYNSCNCRRVYFLSQPAVFWNTALSIHNGSGFNLERNISFFLCESFSAQTRA